MKTKDVQNPFIGALGIQEPVNVILPLTPSIGVLYVGFVLMINHPSPMLEEGLGDGEEDG